MADTTTQYEEEKKKRQPLTYEGYTAPQGTYYGEEGNEASDAVEIIRQRYAEAADPQRQAEEDAKIQRGRQFWTGANLFANVIANAINANGTANGAPNMTWNNEGQRQMFGSWERADQRLRADRRAAQQRLDELQMQDARMRAAAGEKRAAEQQDIAKTNFNIALENDRWERNQEAQAQARQEQWGHEAEVYERNLADKREDADKAFDRQKQLARMRSSGSGSGSGSSTTKSYNVQAGNFDIPAKDKTESTRIKRTIANEIVDRYNKGIDARNAQKGITEKKEDPIARPKNEKEAEAIIFQYFDELYGADQDFKNWADDNYGWKDEEETDASSIPTVALDNPALVSDTIKPQVTDTIGTQTPQASASASASSRGNLTGSEGYFGRGEIDGTRNDGYFIGAKVNNPTYATLDNGARIRVINGNAYPVEGNRVPYRGVSYPSLEEDGRYSGTQRAPHKMTEEEKKLIEQNGEKPKIDY